MGWRGEARYRRWATTLVAVAWLPAVAAGLAAPADAEPLAATVVYTLVTPLVTHLALLVLGWWQGAPFPNSAIGAMLLAPLGIAAAAASEAAMWLPDAASARAAVALALVGVLAWGSGRWAAELVRTDTIDTMS